MRRHIIRLNAFSFLLLLTPAVMAQGERRYAELPNFHAVNERLYRGAQPKSGGFRRLAGLGVRTVVNLRGDGERVRIDARQAQAAGLRFFHVPLAQHARPTDEQIERVLSIINAPEHQPVFVYCRRGADRTGMIVALQRIESEGWTSESAKAEAKRHGMFVTQLEMKDYITDYYCRLANEEGCGRRRLVDRVGTPAAAVTRRVVEEVGRHPLSRGGLRRVRRLIP